MTPSRIGHAPPSVGQRVQTEETVEHHYRQYVRPVEKCPYACLNHDRMRLFEMDIEPRDISMCPC